MLKKIKSVIRDIRRSRSNTDILLSKTDLLNKSIDDLRAELANKDEVIARLGQENREIRKELELLAQKAELLSDSLKACSNDVSVVSDKVSDAARQAILSHDQTKLMLWESMKRENETLEDAKKRFFRSLSPVNQFMELKQTGNLVLLKKILRVAERENLVYWIDFGSLIGVTRHNGPIPWDDDIDICMPRRDYERLIELFADDPEFMTVHWYMTEYDFRITKLVFRKQTKYFFIDIFPLDETPLSKEEAVKIRTEGCLSLQADLTEHKNRGNADVVDYDIDIPEPNRSELDAIFNKNIEKTKRELCSDDADIKGYIYGIDNPTDLSRKKIGFYLEKEFLFPLKGMPFSDVTVNVPNEYDRHLRSIYGDYLSIPNDIYSNIHNGGAPDAHTIRTLFAFIEETAKKEKL